MKVARTFRSAPTAGLKACTTRDLRNANLLSGSHNLPSWPSGASQILEHQNRCPAQMPAINHVLPWHVLRTSALRLSDDGIMATVTTESRKVTFSDLERWPDDGRRYELYDGEVYVAPAPLPRHQLAMLELQDRLRGYAASHGGLVLVSPIDIVFSQYNVLQPDIAFFTDARRHHVSLDAAIRVPPDVVVEVVSPSTVWNDLGRKKATFARFGVPEYWLLDPHIEVIERHVLRAATYEMDLSSRLGEMFSSVVLAGFDCEVDTLFPW